MSELKEHQFCESDEFFREYRGPLSNEMRPYYLKSEADKVIADLKEERRWRKFSEEKPEHDAWCLVFHEGEIDADHYTDDCNSHDRFVMYGHYVTHWMPLPKAPEEYK